MAEAKAFVVIPKSDKKAMEIVLDMYPLVLCIDCKHREKSVSPSWQGWCNRLHCGCDNDWFCADGEEKQNEKS